MNRAPTLTVATATMAAAEVPTAGCTHRRLCVERPGLTVVIVFLHMLIGLGIYLKTARRGHRCHRRWPPKLFGENPNPVLRLVGMLIATQSTELPLAVYRARIRCCT
jgi:hypothetical protein